MKKLETYHIGIVGFGEVGKIFAQELSQATGVASVGVWDIKLKDNGLAMAQQEFSSTVNAKVSASLEVLCRESNLLISAVTASNTLAVAMEVAPYIGPGTVFLDLNSASPETKRQAAAALEARGALYVEAGVMTSVPPYGLRVPMLLGGAHAHTLAGVLNRWGMSTTAVSAELGVASAIKMCRSIMIKGLEALVIESYTTARYYGVEDHVLPTLVETFPSIDWNQIGDYFFSRVVQHGKRRAEEMREVAQTVREASIEPWMASATAEKHDLIHSLAAHGVFDTVQKNADWRNYADYILSKP